MKRVALLALQLCLTYGCAVLAQPSQAVIGERGNWVKQRGWLKEAQIVQEQIQKDSLAIKKSRTPFFTEFERVDKKINEFYGAKGLARGKVTTIVAELKADMQKDKERRMEAARKRSESDDAPINFYDVQREAIEQDVARFERDFEQFNLDMKSVADLDVSLSDRLKAVDKQIQDGTDLAVQSSKKLDEMWWIIDDQKAADAFYVIQGIADKVSSIKKYLDDTLFADFKKVTQTIEKQLEQINKQVEAIEQRGLIVSHRSSRVIKKEVPDVLDVVAEEVADEEVVRSRRASRVTAQSWTSYLLGLPGAFISYVASFWQSPVPKKRRRSLPVESDSVETVVESESSEKEL